jgi:hypothetical protein
VKVARKNPQKKIVKVEANQRYESKWGSLPLILLADKGTPQQEAYTSKRIRLITAQNPRQTTNKLRCNGFFFYAVNKKTSHEQEPLQLIKPQPHITRENPNHWEPLHFAKKIRFYLLLVVSCSTRGEAVWINWWASSTSVKYLAAFRPSSIHHQGSSNNNQRESGVSNYNQLDSSTRLPDKQSPLSYLSPPKPQLLDQ